MQLAVGRRRPYGPPLPTARLIRMLHIVYKSYIQNRRISYIFVRTVEDTLSIVRL